jgi:hypothetical protein
VSRVEKPGFEPGFFICGARSGRRSPSPFGGEGGERSEPGEGSLPYNSAQTPLPPSFGYRLRSGTLSLKGRGEVRTLRGIAKSFSRVRGVAAELHAARFDPERGKHGHQNCNDPGDHREGEGVVVAV